MPDTIGTGRFTYETVEDWFLVYAVVGVMTGGLIALAARQARRAIEEADTNS